MEVKITKRTVDAAAPGNRDLFLWDIEIKGFGLKVTPTASKVYILQYRMGGRGTVLKRYTIGKHGSPWTPDEARTEAARLLRLVADGIDPGAAKAELRTPKQVPKDTVREVAADFIERWAKPRNRSWKEKERTINRDVLPVWGDKRIGDIKKADVIHLMDRLIARGAPIHANRMFATLRKFFNWCVERDLIDVSPVARMRPPSPENERDRWLDDDEIRVLLSACDVVGWPFGPMVQILLLTAQRRDEVAGMRWADIDFEAKMWVLPKELAKNGRAHHVPLSPAAMTILESLPRVSESIPAINGKPAEERSSVFVFTTNGKVPVSGFSNAKRRFDAAISGIEAKRAEQEGRDPVNMEDWVFHDLRRTATTHMAAQGIAPHVVDKILNHVGGTIRGVAAVYNRAEYMDERRHALNVWAQKVVGLIEPGPGNVISIYGRQGR